MRLAPTVGARVGHAAALAEARGAEAGLAALDAIPGAAIARYQPYWALRAHLLGALGHASDTAEAYARAIDLAEDPAARRFLAAKCAAPTRRG